MYSRESEGSWVQRKECNYVQKVRHKAELNRCKTSTIFHYTTHCRCQQTHTRGKRQPRKRRSILGVGNLLVPGAVDGPTRFGGERREENWSACGVLSGRCKRGVKEYESVMLFQ